MILDICPLLPLILNDYSQKTVQSGIELASLGNRPKNDNLKEMGMSSKTVTGHSGTLRCFKTSSKEACFMRIMCIGFWNGSSFLRAETLNRFNSEMAHFFRQKFEITFESSIWSVKSRFNFDQFRTITEYIGPHRTSRRFDLSQEYDYRKDSKT